MSTATAPASVSVRGSAAGRIIRSELLKVWTTNSWWIMGIIALGFTALALLQTCVQASFELDNAAEMRAQGLPDTTGMSPEDIRFMQDDFLRSTDVHAIAIRSAANIFTSGQFAGLLLMVILGALVVTNEYFHQTATTTFLATPRRTQVVLGKLAAAIGLAAGFWLVTTAIDVLVGGLFLSTRAESIPLTDPAVVRSVGMNLVAYVMWAVLGVGLGVLIRSQLGATIVGAAAYLISFPAGYLAVSLIRNYVIKEDWVWQLIAAFPGVASQILVTPERMRFGPEVFGPPWWVGGLVLVGYGLVAGLIGTAIMRKRDIS